LFDFMDIARGGARSRKDRQHGVAHELAGAVIGDVAAAVYPQQLGPDTGRVQPLLDEAAKAYAEKNAGWPTRSEVCDNK